VLCHLITSVPLGGNAITRRSEPQWKILAYRRDGWRRVVGILSAVSRRRQLRLLLLVTLLWAGLAGWRVAAGSADVPVLVVDEDGDPVVGAEVYADGDSLGVTDETGAVLLEWRPPGTRLSLEVPGYLPRTMPIRVRPEGPVRFRVQARMLRGEARDPEGRPVGAVRITSGGLSTTTDDDGRFVLRRAEPGPVDVWRPAWENTAIEWDGGPGFQQIRLVPLVVKAVHIGGDMLADPARRAQYLRMAETTELNALMIDLKDDDGLVWYDSQVATAVELGTVAREPYRLDQVVREADAAGLYVVGRIVTFQDPIAARRAPEMAVWDTARGAPYRKGGQWFLDPTDPAAQDYALQIAREACTRGVDEIQFDYVRYPDGFGPSTVFDQGSDPQTRVRTIVGFLQRARDQLHPLGCAVAADVFGFTTTARDDGGIGQLWPEVAKVVDVISPMLYPSHYGRGWFGFDNPNDYPGEVVYQALVDGVERLGSGTVVRPWLQDFGYDPSQVREQIDSAEEFGFGWMLWNALSKVTMEALRPAGSE